MKNSSFRYLFRFCCDPGFNDERETAALKKFVQTADIDDVTVFANVEELNTGHMSFEEQDTFLRLMKDLAALLKPMGVTLSVNQWHSVMHADLGKRFRPDQRFRPMVDPTGRAAELCVCPLCAEWQAYIGQLYARYATLDADILWVEDDFRLHNHDPLTWGGCFCDEHMKLYSQAAGKELTREAFVRGVLQPGEVHPYRKIWLDVSRETMLSAARAIHAAVRKVNDRCRVGLMSSVPWVHAAEGRNWPLLLETLCEGAGPVCRVHLPAYQEQVPAAYLRNFNRISMQCAAFLPEGTAIYPELENYPYSLHAKSRKFTRFQLLSALPLNLKGMTLDLYDLNGNGIVFSEGYQEMLRDVKPFLNRMQETGVFAAKKTGVCVLCSQDASRALQTTRGESMEELYPKETLFAALLPAYGIPFRYAQDTSLTGEIVAVSGQALRDFPKDEVEALFRRNTVILSGDAMETLVSLGLGRLASVESLRRMAQNGGEHTYEQVSNGRVYVGRPMARASTVVSCTDVVSVSWVKDAPVEEYSAFHDSFRRRTACAEAKVNGRVISFPFCQPEDPWDIPPMLLNTLRQELMQDMLGNTCFPMVADCPGLTPYAWETPEGFALYLVCAAPDGAREVRLRWQFTPARVVAEVSTENEPRDIAFRREGALLILDLAIPAMETALVRFFPGV